MATHPRPPPRLPPPLPSLRPSASPSEARRKQRGLSDKAFCNQPAAAHDGQMTLAGPLHLAAAVSAEDAAYVAQFPASRWPCRARLSHAKISYQLTSSGPAGSRLQLHADRARRTTGCRVHSVAVQAADRPFPSGALSEAVAI
ncbi:hypothetical protein PsYK624_033790 [Phanerochaete sordida]|uniref:Uncharacterized protein n=1 Tax=Phanerochaete sordida TaxID=48140 RepID=A0A9P3L9I1_9APHY|nr:hypothetical protein PsYK624_033790 [Phanerochaete sordida]